MSKSAEHLAREKERINALMREERERGEMFWRYRHTLRVGDPVLVRGEDPWSRCSPDHKAKRYPVGSPGVIVGFAVRSVCRLNTSAKTKPGIYVDQEWPFVRLAGASDIRRIRANHLQLLSYDAATRLELQRKEHPERAPFHGDFICDLPDTEVWEGDIVRPKPWLTDKVPEEVARDSVPGLPGTFVVSWMSFVEHPGDVHESLGASPRFTVSDRFFRKGGGSFYDFQLEVVERGNLWRRAHGQRESYRDLEEEAFFLYRMGELDPAPEHSPSFPTREEAVAAVRIGPWHGIRYYDEFLDWGSSTGYTVIRYRDDDTGRRIAEATLTSGFMIPGDCEPPA